MTAKRLEAIGREVFDDGAITSSNARALIAAIAAMLAEALKEKKQRPKKPLIERADYQRGLDRLALLSKEAPDAVLWSADPRTVVALGSRRCDEDDLYDLGRYLRQGGLSWMREKPALSYVVRRWAELLARSKEQVRPELPGTALDQARKR